MKIACFVLIYDNIEIIKRSLTSIMKYSDVLDIHVVENPSEYTELFIKPTMLNLVELGKIKSYTLFDENIRSNAFASFFYTNHADVWNSDYLLVTDGDIVAEGDWLEEQIRILDKYKDVFCCSLKMSQEGWSQGLIDIFPNERSKNEDYTEIDSGMWLCMFRTSEYKRMFELFCDNRIMIRDGPIKRYVSEYLKMKWVVANNSIAYELTRSGYTTPDYLSKKRDMINNSENIKNFWVHSNYSSFEFFMDKKRSKHDEPSCINPRPESEGPADDWISEQLNSGVISFDTLYFGVNIKNIVKGSASIGNSDTLSFYDKNSGSLFIRCNLIKRDEYQNLLSCFNFVFLYDTFENFESKHWDKITSFVSNALRHGGSIRFTLKRLDITAIPNDSKLFESVCRILGLYSFGLPEQVVYDKNIDLPGENRYETRQIYSARKLR